MTTLVTPEPASLPPSARPEPVEGLSFFTAQEKGRASTSPARTARVVQPPPHALLPRPSRESGNPVRLSTRTARHEHSLDPRFRGDDGRREMKFTLSCTLSVIPAKAGIQSDSPPAPRGSNSRWIPAFAGMTGGAK